MERIGIYIRRGCKTDVSLIQAESDMLKDFACPNGGAEVKLYIDNGYSGIRLRRPALKQMLKDCKKGKLDKIVVKEHSRLTRKLKHFYKLRKKLDKAGVAIVIKDREMDKLPMPLILDYLREELMERKCYGA